jgi:hypothetical protein
MIEAIALAAGLVLVNTLASVRVVRENRGPVRTMGAEVIDTRARLLAQLLVVWLLPLIGALMIWALYSPPRRPPGGPGNPDAPNSYVVRGGGGAA